jgi:hypothetical protein
MIEVQAKGECSRFVAPIFPEVDSDFGFKKEKYFKKILRVSRLLCAFMGDGEERK